MQKRYEDLTPQEKGSLLISSDVYAFLGTDPKVAVDYCGFSGTIDLPMYFDIKNASTLSLFFKIEGTVLSGDVTKWSELSSTFPAISANSSSSLKFVPKREVPSAYLEETLRLSVKAFKDSDYTELFGEDYVDYTFYFFDHTQGTIIHFGDFETGTDGWTGNVTISRTKSKAYTGAYSIMAYKTDYDGCEYDSSGAKIPKKSFYLQQTFDLSGYSKVFFILHPTYWNRPTVNPAPNVFRIWTSNEDYIFRLDMPKNSYSPRRIATYITPGSSVTIHWIGGFNSNNTYHYVDSIILVGFS